MASVFLYSLICAVLTFVFFHVTNSQDPTAESMGDPYKPMILDYGIRGSHNTSSCLQLLFNCWEAVRPGILCVRKIFYETICDKMRNLCHDVYGPVMYFRDYNFIMFEGYCKEETKS